MIFIGITVIIVDFIAVSNEARERGRNELIILQMNFLTHRQNLEWPF